MTDPKKIFAAKYLLIGQVSYHVPVERRQRELLVRVRAAARVAEGVVRVELGHDEHVGLAGDAALRRTSRRLRRDGRTFPHESTAHRKKLRKYSSKKDS